MNSKIDLPSFSVLRAFSVLRGLDSVRSSILKTTMSVPAFRRIFTTRSYRLFFFFLISVSFNLLIALKAPLWVLLLGPLVFGVPHLISSIRYVPRLSEINPQFLSKKIYLSLGSFFVLMASLRIWALSHQTEALSRYPNGIELIGCALTVVLIGLYSKQGARRVMTAALVLSALFFVSFKYPVETLGSLVLIHNLVGFIFWIQRARSQRDRVTAIASTVIFLSITLLLLFGAFDVFMNRPTGILGDSLNDISIGTLIFPKSGFSMWARAVSAYAFGQGVHYFVWLKAIPEQELNFEHPTSFSQSAKFLVTDLGSKLAYAGGAVTIGLLLFAALGNFPEARILYLSGAAFHGYFEIAGLAFVRSKLS